ncbi:MAG: stage II sporulation protein P [Clostridia bacterium]|nr:stage II sporulation protein P [Clostridia bacterium]
MRRSRKRFFGQVLSLRKHINHLLIYLAMFMTIIILILRSGFTLPQLPASFVLNSMQNAVVAFSTMQKVTWQYSAYDILSSSIPSIRASYIMSKKYAAKYGGVLKKEINSPIKNVNDMGPVLETDVSAKGLSFINSPGYDIDADTLLNAPLKFSSPYNGPRVLIIHTHTSEGYAESPESRSEDSKMNVVSVGKEIADALKKEGIEVIHDTTQNDYPSYNQSYKKAMSLIEKNLTTHPTIEVILDIHRDYMKKDDGTLVKPTITLKNGEKAAQIMFVVGTDNMNLYHPDWRHNLSFAVKIQNELNHQQPGLCRSINLRTERFNQHATKGSLIIEVGTGVNTLAEAKNAGRLVGEAVASMLIQHGKG